MGGIKNWWYYYKWYVLLGLLLLVILLHRMSSAFGWFSREPDLQIAYIGKTSLPDDTAKAVVQSFTDLVSDYNKDGSILVQLNQYVSGSDASSGDDSFYYQYASEIEIIGDINDCESYLFHLEDPLDFQRRFQILATPDGNCPEDADFTVEGKGFYWKDCSLLADQDLSSYTISALGYSVSGTNQELLSNLFISRRYYDESKTPACKYAYDNVWKTISSTAK